MHLRIKLLNVIVAAANIPAVKSSKPSFPGITKWYISASLAVFM